MSTVKVVKDRPAAHCAAQRKYIAKKKSENPELYKAKHSQQVREAWAKVTASLTEEQRATRREKERLKKAAQRQKARELKASTSNQSTPGYTTTQAFGKL